MHMTSFQGLIEAGELSITTHLSMQEICEGPGEKKSSEQFEMFNVRDVIHVIYFIVLF